MTDYSYALKTQPKAQAQSIISKRARAAVKRDVKDGSLSLAAALRQPMERLGDMPTYELLLSVPRLSRGRLAIINDYAMIDHINLCLPVVVLTERQRDWIVAVSRQVCYAGAMPGWEERKVEARIAKLRCT
jgi:hypothetical protein